MEEKKYSIKEKVMKAIRDKKITMRSRFIFVLEKFGLESALVGVIILGALIISMVFYFLKKTGLLKFVTLGVPGIKIILLTLPYDYIALAIACIILAIYFANQIELFCGNCTQTNRFAIYFLIGSVILGIFFGVVGVGDFLKGWSKKDIPRESSIRGQVQSFSSTEIMVDENGRLIRIFIETPKRIEDERYEKGKYLRAIGTRDLEDENLFHAQILHCCDEY